MQARGQTGEWTWMGGSNTNGAAGVYGTLGTPSASNIPGARDSAARWTDGIGNFWLLGGEGVGAICCNYAILNDLWMFNPSTNEWTWMGGSTGFDQAGVYGVLGTPASGNFPGARAQSSTWTDQAGRLWLLGGYGIDSNGDGGLLNDLWVYDPQTSEWAWVAGNNTVGSTVGCSPFGCGQTPVYGTLGTPALGNTPGGLILASTWIDSLGDLLLVGGDGLNASRSYANPLNDLWEFNPSTSEWTWWGGGSLSSGADGFWSDSQGNWWDFDGGGDAIWEFNPANKIWALVDGSTDRFQPGVYGTLARPSRFNNPGNTYSPSTWTDSTDHLWLFGGQGFDANGYSGYLNDLLVYYPAANEWAWMSGSSTTGGSGNCACGRSGVYGTLGTPAASNAPGGRYGAASWTDKSGAFWLFAGWGIDANGNCCIINDLWKYEPAAPPPTLPTTITVAHSPNPSAYGESVTFVANVTSSAGAPPNGETVLFESGTTVLGTVKLSGGKAKLTTSTLPQGTDSVSAAYGGDANLDRDSVTATQTVYPPADFTITAGCTVPYSPSGPPYPGTCGITNQGPNEAHEVRVNSVTMNGASCTWKEPTKNLTADQMESFHIECGNVNTVCNESNTLTIKGTAVGGSFSGTHNFLWCTGETSASGAK